MATRPTASAPPRKERDRHSLPEEGVGDVPIVLVKASSASPDTQRKVQKAMRWLLAAQAHQKLQELGELGKYDDVDEWDDEELGDDEDDGI